MRCIVATAAAIPVVGEEGTEGGGAGMAEGKVDHAGERLSVGVGIGGDGSGREK